MVNYNRPNSAYREQKPHDIIAQSEQGANYYTFPYFDDLTSKKSSHTMMIIGYRSVFGEVLRRGGDALVQGASSIVGAVSTGASMIGNDELQQAASDLQDRIDNLGETNSVLFPGTSQRNFAAERRARILGQISREIDATFEFYMPNPIIFQDGNSYDDISLMEMGSSFITNAATVNPAAGILTRGTVDAVGGAAKLTGYPINPKIEILFKNKPQRRFEFEFMFSPESESESEHLREAIQTLRMTASPEKVGPANGILWRSPDTYDIKFFHNGEENTMIPRVQECVMESIEVDYTQTGMWTTFSNGFPVQTRMRLQFREREPNDRLNIEQGNF